MKRYGDNWLSTRGIFSLVVRFLMIVLPEPKKFRTYITCYFVLPNLQRIIIHSLPYIICTILFTLQGVVKHTVSHNQTNNPTNNHISLCCLFCFQIQEFQKLDSDEERIKCGREIYDNFIMKELVSRSHVSRFRCCQNLMGCWGMCGDG